MVETKDLYWAAGLIEGEGCFRINKSAKYPHIGVHINMTDRDVLESVCRILKCGYVTGPYPKPAGKPIYTWQVNTQKDSAAVMMTLYPLLHPRRQAKIRECLEVWKKVPYRNPLVCRKGHAKKEKGRCQKCDQVRRALNDW